MSGAHRRGGLVPGSMVALASALMAALVLVSPAALAAVPDPTLAPMARADPASVVQGSYVVVLNDGPASAASSAARSATAAGADVQHVFSSIDGYSARLTSDQLLAVRLDPNVAYVEADQVVRASSTQSAATWGLDRIDQRTGPGDGTYTYTATGAGVDAYVVDSGILGTHQQFSGRVAGGFSFVKDGRGTRDCHGHGTHVAGTLGGSRYGVAKAVTLVPLRVLDCNGNGKISGVIAAVDWVTVKHSGPSVANLSLDAGISDALDLAVTRAVASGVSVTVAAGNQGQSACNVSPARSPNALTVGATTRTDSRDTTYSNFGTCLDLFAPGTGITSAWIGSSSATRTMDGTSMAAAHVAGVAALYLQGHPAASPATVTSAIVATATSGAVGMAGTGSPNRLVFSPLTGGGPPPPVVTCSKPASGWLARSGASATRPAYSTGAAGTHLGCLTGRGTADLDLYLQKRTNGTWRTVASGESGSSIENVTYEGSAGTYRWRVVSFHGSGGWSLSTARP